MFIIGNKPPAFMSSELPAVDAHDPALTDALDALECTVVLDWLAESCATEGGRATLRSLLTETAPAPGSVRRLRGIEALAAQHALIAFLDRWPRTIKQDNFLGAAEEKYILSLRGVCDEYVTSYYRTLDDGEKAAKRAALKDFGKVPGLALD